MRMMQMSQTSRHADLLGAAGAQDRGPWSSLDQWVQAASIDLHAAVHTQGI